MTPNLLSNSIVAMCPPVEEAVKAEVAVEKIDRRAITSPPNGKLGGRPKDVFVRPEALAESLLQEQYSCNGVITLRRHCGRWYEWRGDYWHERADGDIRAALAGHLQARGVGEVTRLSRRTVDDVVAMLDSARLCALDSMKYRIPCFLPSGESAKGWMPTKNAVIDIETAAAAMERGEPIPPEATRSPSPELFVTYGLPYAFDPTAQCPKFLKYLSEVQPSEENRECLQMLAGLALVPECCYNVYFILCGDGGTGKSVFCDVLEALVGSNNVCHLPLTRFGNRFGLRPLTQRLLNIDSDLKTITDNGYNGDLEETLKKATAGESLTVEDKGVNPWSANVTARSVFACNSLPHIAEKGKAMWDRLRIIPFNQRIRGTEKQNPNLAAEIIAAELPGVLNWALVGLAKLRERQQFPECPEGAALKEEHRLSCDHEREFLTEHVEVAPGEWIGSQCLYDRYREWAKGNGYHPVGATNFKSAVMRVFPGTFTERRRLGGAQYTLYINIRPKLGKRI